jgi:transcriptional regulator with XRE-family HTH domain
VSGSTHAQLYDAFGAYVRSQRQLAQLTLRQAAELARISNPYLSQIEHGLALPSIAVLSALAEALSGSAERARTPPRDRVRPRTRSVTILVWTRARSMPCWRSWPPLWARPPRRCPVGLPRSWRTATHQNVRPLGRQPPAELLVLDEKGYDDV